MFYFFVFSLSSFIFRYLGYDLGASLYISGDSESIHSMSFDGSLEIQTPVNGDSVVNQVIDETDASIMVPNCVAADATSARKIAFSFY